MVRRGPTAALEHVPNALSDVTCLVDVRPSALLEWYLRLSVDCRESPTQRSDTDTHVSPILSVQVDIPSQKSLEMEFYVANVLGLPSLPFLLTKRAVNETCAARRSLTSWKRPPCHVVLSVDTKPSMEEDEASCASGDITETSFSSSEEDSMNMTRSVSFAKPMVTSVVLRPAISQGEKRAMFYRDSDYRLFRKDFYSGKPPRDLDVSFDTQVTIHTYEREATDEELYYSQQDLRRFLEAFVTSLRE